MPGRGHDVQTEPLEVVVGTRQPTDLELAAVAGARVDLADGQRTPEAAADLGPEPRAQRLDLGRRGRRLGHDADTQRGTELPEHQRRACRRVSRVSSRSRVWLPVSCLLKIRRATSRRSPTSGSTAV